MCVYIILASPTLGFAIIYSHSSLIYTLRFSKKRPKRRKNRNLGQIEPEAQIHSNLFRSFILIADYPAAFENVFVQNPIHVYMKLVFQIIM